jgi:hypothetical protein
MRLLRAPLFGVTLLFLAQVVSACHGGQPDPVSDDPYLRDLFVSPQSTGRELFDVPLDMWEDTDWYQLSADHSIGQWGAGPTGVLVAEFVSRFETRRIAASEFTRMWTGQNHVRDQLPYAPDAITYPVLSGADQEIVMCNEGDPNGLCRAWIYYRRVGTFVFELVVQSRAGLTLNQLVTAVPSLVAEALR